MNPYTIKRIEKSGMFTCRITAMRGDTVKYFFCSIGTAMRVKVGDKISSDYPGDGIIIHAP